MIRVNRILHHPTFAAALEVICLEEEHRPFCGHALEHLLSVARLMCLLPGEAQLPRSEIYAAALLHDLGRAEEYRGGASHEEASLTLATPILTDCGFTPQEQERILTAIRQHRSAWEGERTALGELLYRADKKSRPCFFCPAAEACNWPMEKRNLTLEV